MTPEQIDIIRKSFDAMWSMRGDIADLCYSRFFELAPDAKDLFRSDMERTHPTSTPGRRDLPLRIAQAATAALDCWFAFQFQGSRSATLLAG